MTKVFPEIFEKYDFAHFCLAISLKSWARASDYFYSTDFFFGSQKRQDLSKLFSAVQRLNGEGHKDFQDYLRMHADKLVDLASPKAVKKALENLSADYNAKYGMARQIKDFYVKWLSKKDKELLMSKFSVLVTYRPNTPKDLNSQAQLRLDLLLRIRHKYSHAAEYMPLAIGDQPRYILVDYKGKELTWPIFLTFADLYEITRKAMVRYWLAEYKRSLKNGGKAEVDKRLDNIKKETARLNRLSSRNYK